MTSRFEDILRANSNYTSSKWQKFARRGRPIYGSEQQGWDALAYGYKAAADILAKDQIDNSQYRDVLFSPILFLYRHYFELALKCTWNEFFNRGQIADPLPKNEHRLPKLWQPIRKAAVDSGLLMENDTFVNRVEQSIYSIHDIDTKSQHSRYPVVSDRTHSIYIEIEQLICAADDFETLINALDEIARARYEFDL